MPRGGVAVLPTDLAQPLARRRAVVQRRIERRPVAAPSARPQHVFLEPLAQALGGRLERLLPEAGAAPETEREPGLGEAAIGRVEVARLEREATRPGPAQGRIDGAGARRKDAELELDLTHGEQAGGGARGRPPAGRSGELRDRRIAGIRLPAANRRQVREELAADRVAIELERACAPALRLRSRPARRCPC